MFLASQSLIYISGHPNHIKSDSAHLCQIAYDRGSPTSGKYFPSCFKYQPFGFYKKVHSQHYTQRESEDVETGLCNIPVRLNLEERHFGNR